MPSLRTGERPAQAEAARRTFRHDGLGRSRSGTRELSWPSPTMSWPAPRRSRTRHADLRLYEVAGLDAGRSHKGPGSLDSRVAAKRYPALSKRSGDPRRKEISDRGRRGARPVFSDRRPETDSLTEPAVPVVHALTAGRRHLEYARPRVHLRQRGEKHVDVEVHVGQ